MCARVCVCMCHTCARSGRLRSRGCLSWAACKNPGSGSGWAAVCGGRLVAWFWRGWQAQLSGRWDTWWGREAHASVCPPGVCPAAACSACPGLEEIGPRSLPPPPPRGQCCGAEGGRGAVPAGASGVCDAPCQESPGLGPDRGGGMPGSLDEERFRFSAGQGSVSCVQSLGCGEVGELPPKRRCCRHLCRLKVKSLACLWRGRGAGSVPHC